MVKDDQLVLHMDERLCSWHYVQNKGTSLHLFVSVSKYSKIRLVTFLERIQPICFLFIATAMFVYTSTWASVASTYSVCFLSLNLYV